MKIVILETEHFEGAFPVIKLFDMPGNQLTIFTTPGTFKRFQDLFLDKTDRYQWVILPALGKLRFFYTLYNQLKRQKPDLLYINTISNNHLLYAAVLKLVPLPRIVLTVHDINCLFESRASWKFRPAIINRGKKWLRKQVDEFNVVSDTMTNYLQTKATQKKIHVVPGAVFEGRYSPQVILNPLRIVIPGSLDKRRRDYEQVFDLASAADKELLCLQIILLGGISDEHSKSILHQAKEVQYHHCEIISYDTSMVNQDEFDRQMDVAHFIFIPSVINTAICGDIPEIYGITKSSGNIFDVIKHAKPFIVPAALTISASLKSSCFKYASINALVLFLKKLSASPGEYGYWQMQALANSGNYTLEKVRERNNRLFLG